MNEKLFSPRMFAMITFSERFCGDKNVFHTLFKEYLITVSTEVAFIISFFLTIVYELNANRKRIEYLKKKIKISGFCNLQSSKFQTFYIKNSFRIL